MATEVHGWSDETNPGVKEDGDHTNVLVERFVGWFLVTCVSVTF